MKILIVILCLLIPSTALPWTEGSEAGGGTTSSSPDWRWKTDAGDSNLDLEDVDNDVDVVTIEQGAPASSMTIEATTGSVIFDADGNGTLASPSIALGDGGFGLYAGAQDAIYFATNDIAAWFVNQTYLGTVTVNGPRMIFETPAADNPVFIYSQDDDSGLGLAEANTPTGVAGGVEAFRWDSNKDLTVGRNLVLGTGAEIIDTSACEGNDNYILKFSDSTDTFTCQADGGAAGSGVGTSADTEVVINTAGALDGDSAMTYTTATNVLNLNVGATTEEGGISVVGNSTASQYVKMLEDTTNGTNFYTIQPANSVTASVTRDPADWDEIVMMVPILSPTVTNNIQLGRIKHPWTITGIECDVTAGTSVVIEIDYCDIDGANCSEIEDDITCGLTNTTDDGTFTDATITADQKPLITIGTVTGSVTSMNISIYGKRDSE